MFNLKSVLDLSILTQREKSGYTLERAVDQSLLQLDIEHESNPFEPSAWKRTQRRGTDHKIKRRKRMPILIEDKNLSGQYFLNPSLFVREVLSRFVKEDPDHKNQWVLIISIAKFGKRVWALIRKHEIRVLQVGFKVALQNIGEAIRVLIRKLALFFKKRGTVLSLSQLILFYHTNNMNLQEASGSILLNDGGTVSQNPLKPPIELKIEDVIPDSHQPRKKFDEAKLKELADSIKQVGLLQPILVGPLGNKFEIVHGERRWRACKIAGKKTIRAEVREISDEEKYEIQLIENLQRESLNPIEEAEAFKQLSKLGHTHEEIGEKIGKSREYVTNKLRLLKLPVDVQEQIMKGELSERHARAILSLRDSHEQKTFAKEIAEKNLKVRETEQLIHRFKNNVSQETSDYQHPLCGDSAVPILVPFEPEVYSALERASKEKKLKKELLVRAAVSLFLQKERYLKSSISTESEEAK